jgi:uncharacterized peroxidase-related enzyme
LKRSFEEVQTPHGTVDNLYRAQSLRPHTMLAHDILYRSVLHHPGNSLPPWFLECVAVYTSLLNRCTYALTHHAANMRRLLGDEKRFLDLLEAVKTGELTGVFSAKEEALLGYTEKLTFSPADIESEDVEALRRAGAADGEILEVNQVCACFNYANRVINGLGVTLGDDVIGYYTE